MTIVNDTANEIIRKSTRVLRKDDYRLQVENTNNSLTPFNELKTVSRNVQIEIKSNVDTISKLRNKITATNGDVEINSSGEYRVYTGANSTDKTTFESGARGRYIPGYKLECGIGMRIPDQALTGTANIEWGYFDSDDGIGYGLDSGGIYVFIKRLGTVTNKVYQSAWNQDKLNGTDTNENPSSKTLTLSKGNIFQIDFVWYGYGTVQWFINIGNNDSKKGSDLILVHQEQTEGQTSISQPNLPIGVVVDNGNSSTALEAFVGGRQASVYGVSDDTFRLNGDYVLAKSAPTDQWTPMVSFRRKSGRGDNQTVRLSSAEIITNQDLLYTFVSGHTLQGETFGDLTDVSPSETVLESDTAASAITGGDFLGGYSFATSSKPNAFESTRLENLNFEFVNSDIVSLVVKPLTTNATVQAILDVRELW